MKYSEGETRPDPAPPGGREAVLAEVMELQMGMLWMAQHEMRQLVQRFELHPPHLMVLNLLSGHHPDLVVPRSGELSMRDVSRSLDMPPASATALIDRLTTLGLVQRAPAEHDRRVVMVRLTPQGTAVAGELNDHWRRVQSEAFSVFDDEQLQVHLALLRHLQQGYLARYPATTEKVQSERGQP
jgi:DNA-binding MarR family transcriptional regulator